MQQGRLKIAFLIGRDDAATQAPIARACELKGVEVVAVLVDTEPSSAGQRWRNLRRNIRREGLSYLFYRALSLLRERLEAWADRVIPREEVDQLLRQAFPERGLDRLAERYGFRLIQAGNLNGPAAAEHLRAAGADLGVVLGTRILKRAVFAIPRLGCINLHKGKVPEYRGTPPGFWELYDGQESAGVTVHFVDDGVDTGDVVAASQVSIHGKETPESLRTKLDQEGSRLLVSVIAQFAEGAVERQPQPHSAHKARTRPTRQQQNALARRLPHWRRLPDGRQAVKTALWLAIFHGGVFRFVRRAGRKPNRGAILLYHRVNDTSVDVLTTSTRRFAEHLVALRHYYHVISTADLVERIAQRAPIEPTAVAIHFDDCYRDVRLCAVPLLAAAGAPAVAFVSSGFVDTTRAFAHDRSKYPHTFENLRSQDLRDMPALGVDIAAHTVNHADLGAVSLAQAEVEVVEPRRQLEQLTGRPVMLFSFPFGKLHNIREEVQQMVVAAGYRALFAAHGGFVDQTTSLFDIPRIGVSSDHSALSLLMELEGISLSHLRQWFQRRLRRPR